MRQLVSVGVDVAKEKFDAALLFGSNTYEVSTFANTDDGIGKFLGLLKKQRTAEAVPCVLESTGLYHLNAALKVRQAGYQVSVINPLITKKYQAASIRNAKTDTIDAMRLAHIAVSEDQLPRFSGDIRSIEARKLVSYLGKLEEVRRQLRLNMKQVELMQTITGMEIDLSATDQALDAINEQIKTLKKRICELAPKEAGSFAEQVKGVSKEKMAIVLSLLGDKEFVNRDQLVAFVGLDVMPRESGTWRGKGRLSKRGNSYLRTTLYRMAWGLKTHNEVYQNEYERLRAKGKPYTVSMIILARKFLRFLYAYYWKKTCPQISC